MSVSTNLVRIMTEAEKYKALVLIDYWQEQFPVAFPKKPAPKVPLKIGIGQPYDMLFLASYSVGATQSDIQNALHLWCRGRRYWQSFKVNKYRYSVLGHIEQLITEKDVSFARFKLRTWIYGYGE